MVFLEKMRGMRSSNGEFVQDARSMEAPNRCDYSYSLVSAKIG
jgi:hypothetical protein